ncbi:sigma 54-interacting transcriptional regulator [Altererythrobacter sp. H2]|uniref:sigma 54-interacting transcriptional regulator n=1 Tax=Altererythrobacter sp. H2 TaxID=3108391 RepID=UPI002B4BD1E8|nr:sigma 54-interacting transcriptional regulator [Altererythrobacter sp. H2]WRK94587.1 sigma 54-interacting transcriptional regulator [Altererythrobacter sp. H2]
MKHLPAYTDLTSRLRFSPEQGRIWRDSERCVLLSNSALTMLRNELVVQLGLVKARRLFWELGFAEGARCAVEAKHLRPGSSFLDAFAVGPQAHAVTGFGWTEIETLETDTENGHFEGRFLVHDSIEAGIHLATEGVHTDPVCWLQTGFASGFASTFAGQPIIMREIECQGMGHRACLLHGKPEAEWPNLDDVETNAVPLDPAVSRHQDKHFVAGVSAGFNAVRNLIERTARTDASLLFLGETGVGKEVFAKLAHRLSLRNDAPFVALNCAAIPEGLIEAELFGVAKGAFTGAGADRPGRFELADGGTLFLDEISMLSPLAQSKVLRAIQEGEFERVGDTRTIQVNVRLIAASNVDLEAAMDEGTFRADLYFRLSTLPIRVPPLRERREDIPGLMEHFRRKYAKRHGRAVEGFTARSINALLLHDYPGNVRELERMVERAVLLADESGAIDLRHLFIGTNNVHVRRGLTLTCDGRVAEEQPVDGEPFSLSHMVGLLRQNGATLTTIEDAIVRSAIDAAGGNVAQAARELGLTRRQLSYKVEKMQSCD